MIKKSQVSTFIIVGFVILLVLIVSSFFLWRQTQSQLNDIKKAVLPLDVSNVNLFVTHCLDRTSQEALFFYGISAGNIHKFKHEYDMNMSYPYNIPYYYYRGENNMVTKEDVQNILENYVDVNLYKCIDDFRALNWIYVDYDFKDIKTKVKIDDFDVTFNMNWPLLLKQGDLETELTNFDFTIPLRMTDYLNFTKQIVDYSMKDDSFIRWDYLTDLTRNYSINITAHAGGQDTIIYKIVDEEYKVFNEPYVFQFATKVRPNG